MQDVQTIMNELQGLPNLDAEMMKRLEADLERAEDKVKEANLDKVLENLKNKQREQNELIDYYNKEIMRLEAEVRNVADIANALPDGCFRRVKLEP